MVTLAFIFFPCQPSLVHLGFENHQLSVIVNLCDAKKQEKKRQDGHPRLQISRIRPLRDCLYNLILEDSYSNDGADHDCEVHDSRCRLEDFLCPFHLLLV